MKMNEQIIRYLDGDMLPEEKIEFEKEISDSIELKMQLSTITTALKKTNILKEAEINNDYFVNMIPVFRNNQTSKRERIMNPAYAGSVLMILTFLVTMIFQNSWNTNSVSDKEITSDQFNQEEISSMLSSINYGNSEFDLTSSDEMNLDSLINNFITDDILASSGNESMTIQYYEFNPDEVELNDVDTENLYSAILSKKFF